MTINLSREEARAILSKPKRPKYGNVKVTIDGHTFDSRKEGDRYLVLKAKEKAGEISHLDVQPKFKLLINGSALKYESGRQAVYIADFAYFDPSIGKRIVEDVKSPATKTPLYKLKKALVEKIYPAVKIIEI
ncbi:DUF1064 domain-containing protein [Rhizobium lentis]|uniref:DUF1064 domain-containing protein n=1 Tax=Rhizobium lentis TaxID=1138194 RepID=UPI001C840795|nr:DUF1064 domain-containing protein [Rhizobium lentis]MBX5131627.1 DUF1064 domain-containing protein [Rhizobium lentis]